MYLIRKTIKSMRCALAGIVVAMDERNVRIHLVTAGLVIFFSWFFDLSRYEWALVVSCIAVVVGAEIFNTAIENVCNRLRDDLGLSYEATRDARDISAGAVMVIGFGASIVGILIFLPRVISYVGV